MKRMRVIAGILAGVTSVMPAVASADGTLVISAHRAAGVSGGAANSLGSFVAAAETGERDIEGDAWVTSDGFLVLGHDSPLLAPRCSGPYLGVPIRSLTVAQVAKMSCGGEQVARVDRMLEALRPYPASTLRLEIKHASTDTAAMRSADAVRLAREIAREGMTARSILQDFSWETTTPAIHAASPGQRVSALSSTITVGTVALARSLGTFDFSYREWNSTAFWNRLIAANGLQSAVWTPNDATRARVLREEGVGTIITDVPAEIHSTLAAPGSECSLSRFDRTRSVRGKVLSLVGGKTAHVSAPLTAPDGRVVETTLLRVRASTSAGTATLRIAPQGTSYTASWEQSLVVTTTAQTTIVEVALGDVGGIRLRNLSSGIVALDVAPVGGVAYTCH